MSSSERIAIAAHLHVLLRRKLGRIVDTEWLASNEDYAREIVRLCKAQEDDSLHEWADKLDRHYAQSRPPRPADIPSAPPPVRGAPGALEQRYVGRLR